MCRQNHGVAVDYFALGVMAYEFMMGRVWDILLENDSKHFFRDLIKEDLEKKLETKFSQNKSK